MAQGSFLAPSLPANLNPQSNGPWNLALEFTCSAAGQSLFGVYFYKLAGDTGVHTATVYRTDTQAVVAQQAFSGESASGWQFLSLTTPVPLIAGLAYRVAVSHNTASYQAANPFNAITIGPYTLSATGWALAGSGTGYPTGSYAWWFAVDVLVDGMPASALRASQLASETWVTGPVPALRASQAALDVFVQGPPSTFRVSQAAVEVWAQQGTFLVASQDVLEVWAQITPRARAYREGSGVV